MAISDLDWSPISRAVKADSIRCHLCGKPSRSERGDRAHYLACHSDSKRSERNWNIAMMYFEGGRSPREIASHFDVSPGAVLRVLNTVTQYPYHYELDPELLRKIIPLKSKRTA